MNDDKKESIFDGTQNEELRDHEGYSLDLTYPDPETVFFVPAKIHSIKDECLVFLDTNALLTPYNIGPQSLNQIKQIFTDLVDSNRLIIPGQVAREFAKQKSIKLKDLHKQIADIKSHHNLKRRNYPLFEELEEYKQMVKFEKKAEEAEKDYKKSVGKLLAVIREWRWNDPVSTLYANLFSKNVVFDLPINKELKEVVDFRFDNSIPPGYKDKTKESNWAGDFIIWQTILEIGKKKNKDVIFVTDDSKPDWWEQSAGYSLYPRFELINEFNRVSQGHTIHILKFSDFLELFGAEEDVIQEVEQEEDRAKSEGKLTVISGRKFSGSREDPSLIPNFEEKAIAYFSKSFGSNFEVISSGPKHIFLIYNDFHRYFGGRWLHGEAIIRAFSGAVGGSDPHSLSEQMKNQNTSIGIIASATGFSPTAIQVAEQNGIIVIEPPQFRLY